MAKICVCDDDEELCESLRHALEAAGHRFVPAFSPVDARDLFVAEESFDLLCVGLHQATGDRRENANALKDIAEHIPIVGFAAHEPEGPTSLIQFCFFRAMLVKPFSPDQLLTIISGTLGGTRRVE